jgi:hypothetical protein
MNLDKKITTVELKELCRQRKLKVSGIKAELIQRLKLHEISSLNQPQLTINENIVINPCYFRRRY